MANMDFKHFDKAVQLQYFLEWSSHGVLGEALNIEINLAMPQGEGDVKKM